MNFPAETISIKQVIEPALIFFNDNFPNDAVAYAIEHKEQATPLLLGYLKHAITEVDTLDPSYMGHMYALFILSQFRETQAFPLVVHLCKLTDAQQDMLLGDSLTENLAQFLACTYDGNLSVIKDLVEDESIEYFARSQTLYSFLILLNLERLDIAFIDSYIRLLFPLFSSNTDTNGMTMLVNFCLDFNPSAYQTEIKKAFKLKLVHDDMIDLNYVLREIKRNKNPAYQTDRHYQPIEDTSKEMSWWACFNERETPDGLTDREYNLLNEVMTPETHEHHHGNHCGCGDTTVRYSEPKLGRNDPCYCGSGKKFKKCCLN
jgi:uncharacterized protein YchJ